MIHDAAGIGRIDARRVKGGLTPTPAMPGMDRWWDLATKVASSG
jgi:hypothetical protein